MPGNLRHPLLSGPDAPKAGAASAAGVLPGRVWHGEHRGAETDSGRGLNAVAQRFAGAVPGGVLRRFGLRHCCQEAVADLYNVSTFMKHIPGFPKSRFALAVALIVLAALLGSQPAPREQVGPLPGGGFLLN